MNEQVEETLKYSHIAILVIDAMEAFQKQDMMVVQKILEEG